MAERHLLVVGCLFWYALRVVSFNLQEDWSTTRERETMTNQAIAKAKDERSYYFVLQNKLQSEIYYRVRHGDEEVAEGYIASESEKCVVLESLEKESRKYVVVFVGGYGWWYHNEDDVYVFIPFTNFMPIPRGTTCTFECNGKLTFLGSINSQLRNTYKRLTAPPDSGVYQQLARSELAFTKEEFEESSEMYTEISNSLTSPIEVTVFCKLVHVSDSENGMQLEKREVQVWEEAVPAGREKHCVKLKKRWFEYVVDWPWVMKMRGKVDGFSFSCTVEPLSATDPSSSSASINRLNRHSHYELTAKYSTQEGGIRHVVGVQMKATITTTLNSNSEQPRATKDCAKMEE